ncbi:MAG: hypothetical protein M0Z63_13705 [Actinomycetota bacterium]|nr:hypothetical protein [Actinomycetota bacterium]
MEPAVGADGRGDDVVGDEAAVGGEGMGGTARAAAGGAERRGPVSLHYQAASAAVHAASLDLVSSLLTEHRLTRVPP